MDMDLADIHPNDFTYDLPESRIAKFPLDDRSASKLLHYSRGNITHHQFIQAPNLIPENSLVVFNNTKVIPARMIVFKSTGARIEILLLEPSANQGSMEEVMNRNGDCTWRCMIGNAKKWKLQSTIETDLGETNIILTRISEDSVRFSWNSDTSFSSLLHEIGKIPLPPYLNRAPTARDTKTYQTIYAQVEGAVAAPTAGLHFTEDVIDQIKDKHQITEVTLHVSAGTFKPIKTTALEHDMHREQVVVNKAAIQAILEKKKVISVGTTSMRTLESLYWYGVRLSQGNENFEIDKAEPYYGSTNLSRTEAIREILEYMEKRQIDQLVGHTEIFLVPGYDFRVVDGLFTNFHLPGTTLMMLVAAFVGPDWEDIYQQALDNEYRFLSYGDSSLLIR